ncbi:MAG: hypothetical protein V3V45_00295 [Candidatus Brocadiales bacterium]
MSDIEKKLKESIGVKQDLLAGRIAAIEEMARRFRIQRGETR